MRRNDNSFIALLYLDVIYRPFFIILRHSIAVVPSGTRGSQRYRVFF